MTERELGWLAGMLESEGSFSQYGNCSVMFRSTDEDIVARVAELMETKPPRLLKPKAGAEHCKPYYYTAAYGKNAIRVIDMIYSELGIRRKSQTGALLASWRISHLP